jgi:aspartyl/asparaginyl beta-hydroxylase (cupin superfamily)
MFGAIADSPLRLLDFWMNTPFTPAHDQLERDARRAAQEGRDGDAAALWTRLLEAAPGHYGALTALGIGALRRGDPQRARALLQQAADAQPGQLMAWINLAMACKAAGDVTAEEAAVSRALAVDPQDLIALVMQARILDRQGRTAEALQMHTAVTKVAPPLEQLSADLKAAVQKSQALVEENTKKLAAFLDERLPPAEAGQPDRFRESVDILLGRRRRYVHEQVQFFYPRLDLKYFFERELFPFLDAIEAATDEIRAEFLKVHQEDRGFSPYLIFDERLPVNQFKELNNSTRWNAFHLLQHGERVEANASRCPRTMELLATAPQPRLPGRAPNAMFSLLAPRTHIPPHSGVHNTRLVTHVPLIIPEGCTFRVGSDVRPWKVGQAWAFDDTIEHEAMNDSDELRVILMFDIWRPDLSEDERGLLTRLAGALDEFSGSVGTSAL